MRTPVSAKARPLSVCLFFVFLFLFAPSTFAAFSFGFDGTTLTLTQTVDDGNIVVDDNGAANAIRTTDSSGTVEYSATTNLVVILLDSTGNQLDVELNSALAGSLTLTLGEGLRAVNMTGFNNDIGGDFTVTAGSGDQTVEVAVNANLGVFGALSISLGTGVDTVDEDGNDLSVTGDVTLNGVNEFETNGTTSFGANVFVDVSFETETTRFDDDSAMSITGNFTFMGGPGRDEVLINDVGASPIGGFAYVDLGDNTVGGTQFAWFNSAETSVAGDLTVLSTSSANPDDFQSIAGFTVGGTVLIDLGDGANEADFLGTFNGTGATYQGGDDVDEVVIDVVGASTDFDVFLGDSADAFTLAASTDLSSLFVDFGACDNGGVDGDGDSFTDGFAGTYPFTVEIQNLDGCNSDLSITKTDNVDPVLAGGQLIYTVRVDNAGPSNATGVVVTDTLPAGTALQSTSGCAEDPSGVPTCSLGAIEAGGFAEYTITVGVDSSLAHDAVLDNAASVTSATADANLDNNDTNEETTVFTEAYFYVSKIVTLSRDDSPVDIMLTCDGLVVDQGQAFPGAPPTILVATGFANGATSCTVTEVIPDEFGVFYSDGCSQDDITSSVSYFCDIENIAAPEPIPTLNPVSLAILSFLVLLMGAVGFRRYV